MCNLWLLALLLCSSIASGANVLWYRQPAKVWNEALPIGNGRLGGMVFGGPLSERIQLNEDTIWAGEKRDRNNPAGHDALPEIRRLLFAGRPDQAEALADRTMIATGRRMRTEGDQLIVEGADAATLFVAAGTSFRERDLDRDLAAARKPYAELRAAHVADYQRLFRRVDLQLGGTAPDLPTDERLKRAADDPALAALYFQFGRYLLISSSRPGSMAATLQGLWNDQLAPSWDSKYTININTEMNYWPAETTNLSELARPLFDLVDAARENGRAVAKKLYGARGFVLHHNTDIWGDAVPIDGVRSGVWPMGGAWLSLHFLDHYDFTRDRVFLQTRAYPVLKV